MFRIGLLAIATLIMPFSQYTDSSVNAEIPHYLTVQNHSHQAKGITAKSLGIGKIKLSMSEQIVRRLLGKPFKVENNFVPAIGNVRTLKYPGMIIDLDEGVRPGYFSVYQIKVNSSKYTTVDGVKVGDTQAKVIQIYGNPGTSSDGKLTNLSYGIDQPSPAGLNFTIKNGKVAEILCFYLMN